MKTEKKNKSLGPMWLLVFKIMLICGKPNSKKKSKQKGKKLIQKKLKFTAKKVSLSINQTVYYMGKMIVQSHEKAECLCVELLSYD